MPEGSPKPTFFKTPADLRKWLAKNGTKYTELWVGFYKKDSGKGGPTYKEALDEALCFGWIDGVRKTLDAESYVQRFTPRKKKSYWSAVNTRRAEELIKEKRMAPPGLKAFEARDMAATARYSFEREAPIFEPADLRTFKANRAAWTFFEAQPPYYRKLMVLRVVSAKREETRRKRLEELMAVSAAGQRMRLT